MIIALSFGNNGDLLVAEANSQSILQISKVKRNKIMATENKYAGDNQLKSIEAMEEIK